MCLLLFIYFSFDPPNMVNVCRGWEKLRWGERGVCQKIWSWPQNFVAHCGAPHVWHVHAVYMWVCLHDFMSPSPPPLSLSLTHAHTNNTLQVILHRPLSISVSILHALVPSLLSLPSLGRCLLSSSWLELCLSLSPYLFFSLPLSLFLSLFLYVVFKESKHATCI